MGVVGHGGHGEKDEGQHRKYERLDKANEELHGVEGNRGDIWGDGSEYYQ